MKILYFGFQNAKSLVCLEGKQFLPKDSKALHVKEVFIAWSKCGSFDQFFVSLLVLYVESSYCMMNLCMLIFC